jgi:hypothetical protein
MIGINKETKSNVENVMVVSGDRGEQNDGEDKNNNNNIYYYYYFIIKIK